MKITSKLQKILFCLIFIVLFYNFVFFISANAVDIPYWDEWDIAEPIMNNMSLKDQLFFQHNEHRIGVPLIGMKLLASFTHWSQIREIQTVSILITICCLLAIAIKYHFSQKLEIWDIIIPLIFFNLLQYENLLWGFQIAFISPVLYIFLAMLTLKVKNIYLRNTILLIISFLSAYSSFHGIFIGIILTIYLIIEFILSKKKYLKTFLTTTAINIFITSSYFIGFKGFNTNPDAYAAPELTSDFWKYILLGIYNAFLFKLKNHQYLIASFLLLLTIFSISFAVRKILREKSLSKYNIIVGTSLILFALMFIFSASYGRSNIGVDQALSSRYITILMLIPLGIYFIFKETKLEKAINIFLIIIIGLNSLAFIYKSLDGIQDSYKERQKAMDCYLDKPVLEYPECHEIIELYPDARKLKKLGPEVFEHKFNTYTEK